MQLVLRNSTTIEWKSYFLKNGGGEENLTSCFHFQMLESNLHKEEFQSHLRDSTRWWYCSTFEGNKIGVWNSEFAINWLDTKLAIYSSLALASFYLTWSKVSPKVILSLRVPLNNLKIFHKIAISCWRVKVFVFKYIPHQGSWAA